MNKGRFSANIRQRRDETLGSITALIALVYAMISLILLGTAELKGYDILTEATIVYLSWMVLLALYISTFNKQGLCNALIRSTISFIALALVLIAVFPARVFLYGIGDYKRYALREVKRITRIESSRWKERL